MSFIYLASPYSSPDPDLMQKRYEVTRAHVAAALRAGVTMFSPIVHCHPLANAHTLPVDFDFWQVHNEAMLAEASDLYILTLSGWKTSKGVIAELYFARQRGIPVRLVSPEEDLTCHLLSV